MKSSKRPLWKKSMLQALNLGDIQEWLSEIGESGDMYGYEYDSEYRKERGENGYYQEYKELFDELSDGAYRLSTAFYEWNLESVSKHWDDMTVALLGNTHKVLGYDSSETDYRGLLSFEEDWAVSEAIQRIERLSKREMIRHFRTVLTTLVLFFDLKASHDCLTAIVEELDSHAAFMNNKDAVAPQRAWVE